MQLLLIFIVYCFIVYDISKEMAVGVYTMTKNLPKKNSPIAVNEEILNKATDPYVRVKFIITIVIIVIIYISFYLYVCIYA